MEKLIEVFNLGGLPTAPLDSFLELQEDFKKSDPDKLSKLQMLIITRGFKYAFKAWQDPDGKLWIIDAHQRRKALLALRKSGFTIPEIPYEPIFAAAKKEAVDEIAPCSASTWVMRSRPLISGSYLPCLPKSMSRKMCRKMPPILMFLHLKIL